jgi:hypothetical protein
MDRAGWFFCVGIVSVLVSLGGVGCGGSKPVAKTPAVSMQLSRIFNAYVKATDNAGSPPQSKEDLLPFLLIPKERGPDDPEPEKADEKPDPAEFFKSSGDGEDFVILWGVDYRNFNLSDTKNDSPVIAYEKYGENGKRWVMRFRKVSNMTNEDLALLPFPPGHKAP